MRRELSLLPLETSVFDAIGEASCQLFECRIGATRAISVGLSSGKLTSVVRVGEFFALGIRSLDAWVSSLLYDEISND